MYGRNKKRTDSWNKAIMKATKNLEKTEMEVLHNALFSDRIDPGQNGQISNLMKRYENKLYTETEFACIQKNCRSVAGMERYLEGLLEAVKQSYFSELIAAALCESMAEKLNERLFSSLFERLEPEKRRRVIREAQGQRLTEKLFDLFVKSADRPKDVQSAATIYMEKYPESGEVIYSVVRHIQEYLGMVDFLPELVERYSKKWLMGFNCHNNEKEIVSVINALEDARVIEKLCLDFAFWAEMERCNAFFAVIENLCLCMDFQEGYRMIENNYFAARAYGFLSLASKWLQAAERLAMQYEGAQKPFVQMMVRLTGDDGRLDSVSRMKLIQETINYLASQARENREREELEKNKALRAEEEKTLEVIQRIFPVMEKMEKEIITRGLDEQTDSETVRIMADLMGKLRTGLAEVGILYSQDVESWKKRQILFFDPAIHKCQEELRPGDPVICLSMGVSNRSGTCFERANVKKYIGDGKDGCKL